MFIHLSTIFSAVATAGIASAVPTDLEVRNSGTCNSGTVLCCETIQDSYSSDVASFFYWLNLPLPPSNTMVGLACSPVTIVGTGHGSTCTQQTVCCVGSVFAGVASACSPIVINQ